MADARAGQPAQLGDLIDVEAVQAAYFATVPDPTDPGQRVVFGTSGHRGTSLNGSFNEAHILATTQAIAEHRRQNGIDGPLFLARDTHLLSGPAWETAVEVLVANGVHVLVDSYDRFTSTPALSHAILTHNARGTSAVADGIVVTPSHNPPQDGGFKYNPPNGGPADGLITAAIAVRANELLEQGLRDVRRVPLARALKSDLVGRYDFLGAYVDDLASVVDLAAIRMAGISIGADPMGGASVGVWAEVGDHFNLDLTVVNPTVDPTFSFMTLDTDGKIRMDCSSPNAMASLISQRDAFDIATGNDADSDRHGIVTPDGGLLNPNHYLAVAIEYLFGNREGWSHDAMVGKTLVSSVMIDRVAEGIGRKLFEVPVGFKHFVSGLLNGSLGFGGEESAGASFLRVDGGVWTTDKDGIIMALLASEILAKTDQSPSQHYQRLEAQYGSPVYARIDAPATREEKAILGKLTPAAVKASALAGEMVTSTMTAAPGNGAPIGGLKVSTENAWFAARPSGTEDVYKIYAESLNGPDHLAKVQEEARDIVAAALKQG